MPADPNNTNYAPIPFHIQIGVTGHRKLELTEALQKSIDNVLDKKVMQVLGWDKNCLTKLSFSILTPLAEGADRFVAERARKVLGASIHAVLPMIDEEYKKSFVLPGSAADFERLLKYADSIHHTIKKPLAEAYPEKTNEEQQIAAYEKVGHFVVDHCDILIVIWDGEEPLSEAGTGAIARYAKQSGRTRIIIDAKKPYKISIKKGDQNIGGVLKVNELFNTYKIAQGELETRKEELLKRDFLPDGTEDKIPAENIAFVKEYLLYWYLQADTLAIKNQGKYKHVGLMVYILSPIAVSLVACGLLFHQVALECFMAEFLVLLTAYLAISKADASRFHKKWIGYRSLAEYLRCAIHFSMCGFKLSFDGQENKVLQASHRAESWADEAFVEIVKKFPKDNANKHPEFRQAMSYIKISWIDSQLRFHHKKRAVTGKKARALETFGLIVFFIALFSAFYHVMAGLWRFEEKMPFIDNAVIFVAITFPALGAALGAIRTHNEYKRLEKQSARMVTLLEALAEHNDDAHHHTQLKTHLEQTREIMLRDVQGWHTLMELLKLESV